MLTGVRSGVVAASVIAALALAAPARAGATSDPDPYALTPVEPQIPVALSNPHILGVIPNYKTVEDPSQPFRPLTARGKLVLASRDAFDPRGLPALAFSASLSHVQHQNPSLGLGALGLGKRAGLAYIDGAVGTMVGEALVPTLLHQDPRYYRAAHGRGVKRIGYALSRVLVTRTDSGAMQFNYGELLGNGTTAAIAALYYPGQDRSAPQVLRRTGVQTMMDAGFNVALEYWPDLRKKLFHK